jgi:hypothetical protein
VGVEPTIRSAKGRIGGFEGRDSHRTIFASVRYYRRTEAQSSQLMEISGGDRIIAPASALFGSLQLEQQGNSQVTTRVTNAKHLLHGIAFSMPALVGLLRGRSFLSRGEQNKYDDACDDGRADSRVQVRVPVVGDKADDLVAVVGRQQRQRGVTDGAPQGQRHQKFLGRILRGSGGDHKRHHGHGRRKQSADRDRPESPF